jgi:hypothetical protein
VGLLPTRRTILTSDSIESVLRRITNLPPSREAEELRAKAVGYLDTVTAWKQERPSVEERGRLMKEVLGLYVAVTKLEPPGK